MTVADPSPETLAPGTTEGSGASIPTSSTTDATAGSSPATETVAAAETPKVEGEGSKDAPKPASLLEAAKAALNKGKGADPSSADAKPTPEQPKAGTDGQPVKPADAPKAEGEAEVPTEFSKHPAWVRIAKARDEAKAGAEQWNRFSELVNAAGYGDTKSAEAWMNHGARLNKSGVTAQEQGILVEFAAATKTDPARAFKIIQPIYDALRGIIGEGDLPKDLQDQVASGELTEEHARRIVKSDADKRIAEHARTREGEVAQREREARASQEAGQAMANAVYSWESRMAKTEPDWARIAPLVNEQVGLLKELRNPKTAEEAEKVCNDAVALVKRTIGAVVPARPAVTPPSTPPSQRQQEQRARSAFEHVKRSFAA